MKVPQLVAILLMASLGALPDTQARGIPEGHGRDRGGGRGAPHAASRPAAPRPTPSRPSGGQSFQRPAPSYSRPSSSGSRVPASRPAPRPSPPSQGGGRPPAPAVRPAKPSGSGSTLPSIDRRPAPKPAPRPDRPETRPAPRPAPKPGGGGDDFIGLRPDKPSTKPGFVGNRPGAGGGGEQWKPGSGNRPTRPGQGGGGEPLRPGDLTRPSRPGQGGGGEQWKPGDLTRPGRPGQGGGGEQWQPGGGGNRPPYRPNRPPRPELPGNWQNQNNHFNNQWNNWQQNNHITINNFQTNRINQWNNIHQHYNDRGWHNRFGSDEYWRWRQDVVNFRGNRCREIWDHSSRWHDHFFDYHWWGYCGWRPGPPIIYPATVSPWWWWRPVTWFTAGTFFGTTLAPQPVVYDPGTTVIYEGDTIYINGKDAGNATQYREETIKLASPPVQEVPVPEPAEEGKPETWLPLGVWALTQQEQGDAVMFFQISVDKSGIVAGAFKNIMTGDEQPIVGQLDKDKQRVAWHVGDNTQTVYETGFSGLTDDVTSVFVHFGENQTQTWLLVRLPSPEMPPGSVKLPDVKTGK